MTRPRSLLLLRLLCLVVIGVSMALLIDSLRPLPAFCASGSGCDQIRRSAYGKIAGIPVSAIGLGAYGGLLTLSFFSDARRLTAVAAILGGVIGAGLLATQAFVLHVFCKLCVVVDVSAILIGVAGILLLRSEEPTRDLAPLAWFGALVGAASLPWALVEMTPPSPVPDTVRALWKPGHINVVEFSDFECPFCRNAHPVLEAALHQKLAAPLNFIRKTMPLASHPNARDASRAYLCADAQGKADAMADRLFAGELSRSALLTAADDIGLARESFRACLADPATDARIDEHVSFVRSSNFQGLPTVWINDQLLLGARDEATYTEALQRAAAGGPQSPAGRTWPLALVASLSLGIVGLGLISARGRARQAERGSSFEARHG